MGIDDGAMLIVKLAASGTGERWLEIMRDKLREIGLTENRRASSAEIIAHLNEHCPFKGVGSVIEKAASFMKFGRYDRSEEEAKPLTLEQKMMESYTPPTALPPTAQEMADADKAIAEADRKAAEAKAKAEAEADAKAKAEADAKAKAEADAKAKAEGAKKGK